MSNARLEIETYYFMQNAINNLKYASNKYSCLPQEEKDVMTKMVEELYGFINKYHIIEGSRATTNNADETPIEFINNVEVSEYNETAFAIRVKAKSREYVSGKLYSWSILKSNLFANEYLADKWAKEQFGKNYKKNYEIVEIKALINEVAASKE